MDTEQMEGAEQAPCGGGYLPVRRTGRMWCPPPGSTKPSLPGPRTQPNPRPADTHGSWWDGGLGSLEARGPTAGGAPALGGGGAGRGERAVHRAPSPAAGGGPQLIQNGSSTEAGRKDRWKRRGRAGEGRKGKGENGGEKGREERRKEQMEGKERGKEERKVKTEGGAQAKPGEGEAGPGKGPRPLP